MKTKLFPVFLLIFVCLAFSEHTSPILAHDGEVHTILETSEEHKQKIQECLALPTFQDSCYIELCGEEGTYLCTEDILDAVVQLADPQTAMDVLNGIMQSSLFAIQTNGHLLSHVIGNSIAHHYGFSSDNFLLCPPDFNWGCSHGFFEDAVKEADNPTKVAIEICESGAERPFSRKELCYHGIGHMFLFNESYDIMSALYLCDELPSLVGQERCHDGVLMQKNEIPDFYESKEKLGFRDDDVLAPCNRLPDKYRKWCYINHGKYFCAYAQLSMQEASRACMNAGDHIESCMLGLGNLVTRPSWQQCLMESSSPEPYRKEALLENAMYLCGVIPPDYIEACHRVAISSLIAYFHIQEAMDICSFYWVNEKSDCFYILGGFFSGSSANDADAIQRCDLAPEEYRDNCIEGARVDYSRAENNSIQQESSNTNNQIPHSEAMQENYSTATVNEPKKTETPSFLFYLFITLGCILLITPLAYYNRTLLKKIMKV